MAMENTGILFFMVSIVTSAASLIFGMNRHIFKNVNFAKGVK